jgi:hypothetical protein
LGSKRFNSVFVPVARRESIVAACVATTLSAGVQGDLLVGHPVRMKRVALRALASLVAVWPGGRLFVVCCAGVVAAHLGRVSFVWLDAAGGFDRAWSAAAIAAGVALVAVAFAQSSRLGAAGPA